MRLELEHHRRHPWRVHDLLADFTVDEVWAYPIEADPSVGEDFAMFCSLARQEGSSPGGAAGALIAFREFLGRVFGWDAGDHARPIPGCTETSIRERLPPAEREQPDEPDGAFGFSLVYQTESERLVEVSNATVHAALHVGWVEHEDGSAGAEMAVYWKPRGWLGHLYMGLIAPFRVFVVYPALMRKISADWRRLRRARIAALQKTIATMY